MRSIQKTSGHYLLNQRHIRHQQELHDGTASPKAWDNFHARQDTRDICEREQFGLCAYSETLLDVNDLGMHLDHVSPKLKFPAHTFDHHNLLLSAIDDIGFRKLIKRDVFGGHARGNRYSAAGFIHPLRPDCRHFFHYASDGRVEPVLTLSQSDRRKVIYTITILNLNAPLLVNRRRHWLETLEQEIDQLLDAPVALKHFAEAELCLTNNKLRPFHSAMRERFGILGEQVIRQHCINIASDHETPL
jgi:uncharacterized protein (TIGR02646 family)